MQRYTAGIVYDETTITKLDQIRTSTFRFSQRVVFLLLCIALIIGGVALGTGTVSGMICIVLGAFLIPSAGNMKSSNARQVLRAMKGKMLRMTYGFNDADFTCTAGENTTSNRYDAVIRMVEDDRYFYLFQTAMQVCMIDKETLKPENIGDFKVFLEKKVGLAWTKPVTFRSFSIAQMRFNKKNTRRK